MAFSTIYPKQGTLLNRILANCQKLVTKGKVRLPDNWAEHRFYLDSVAKDNHVGYNTAWIFPENESEYLTLKYIYKAQRMVNRDLINVSDGIRYKTQLVMANSLARQGSPID